MVAGKNHAVGPTDGNPACRLERLGCLVNEKGAEPFAVEQLVGCTHQGRCDDAHLPEDVVVDAHLEFHGHFLEAVEFLVEMLGLLATAPPHLAHVAPHLPQLGVVGVVGKAPFVGETQHLVVDARGVADAQDGYAAIHQFLADPVDGGVALGAHQDLGLAHERLVDGLDQGGRLARAWWAVQHAHVLGPQNIVHGPLLARIQPREAHVLETEGLDRLAAVKQVAQIGQAVALGVDDALQGVKHHAVTRLVKEQLHAQRQLGILQLQRVPFGDGDDHAVTVHIGDVAREVEKVDVPGLPEVALGHFGLEEHDGLAVLEIMVDFLVALARHLDAVLVQRIVVGAPHAQRKPGIAARHLARQADALAVQAISLLLLPVFLAEQFPLHQQLRYGRRVTHCYCKFTTNIKNENELARQLSTTRINKKTRNTRSTII